MSGNVKSYFENTVHDYSGVCFIELGNPTSFVVRVKTDKYDLQSLKFSKIFWWPLNFQLKLIFRPLGVGFRLLYGPESGSYRATVWLTIRVLLSTEHHSHRPCSYISKFSVLKTGTSTSIVENSFCVQFCWLEADLNSNNQGRCFGKLYAKFSSSYCLSGFQEIITAENFPIGSMISVFFYIYVTVFFRSVRACFWYSYFLPPDYSRLDSEKF